MSAWRALVWSLLLFAAAAFVHGNAHAQSVTFPASSGTTYLLSDSGAGNGQSFPSADAACQQATVDAQGPTILATLTSSANGQCVGTNAYRSNGQVFASDVLFAQYSAVVGSPSCGSSGATLSGSTCTCPSGDVLGSDGASCVVPDACASSAGSQVKGVFMQTTGLGIQPDSVCNAGCSAVVADNQGAMIGCDAAGTSCLYGPVTVIVRDSPCTASTSPASSSSSSDTQPFPNPPPAGMCPGTVNGVAVNVPCSTTQTSTGSGATPSTGATADGPATVASSPAGTTPGTSTSGQVTTCSSGSCTTTTTKATNNADGTTTTQSSSATVPQSQFCQQNPTSPQCAATQDAYSSNCNQGAAVPVCTGDPIACATANALAQQNCQSQYVDPATQAGITSLQTNGTSPSAGDSSISLAGMAPATEVASCAVSDTTITVGPMTLNFPLGTVLCPKLAMIHAAVMAFGSFLWVIIVMGIKMH